MPTRRRSRRLRRVVAFTALALVAAASLAPLASGQPRARGKRPPAAARDAGAPAAPPADDADAGLDAEAPRESFQAAPAVDAAAPLAPGLSPLTPPPEEAAPTRGDAGVPIDLDRVLADVVALRARAFAVGESLFRSRVAIAVRVDEERVRLERLTVALDDGVVWSARPGFASSDATPVFERAVAPGKHAITVDAERVDERDPTYRSSQRSRFVVDVPRDHRLAVEVRLDDDSTFGKDFEGDHKGTLDLRVRVRSVAKPVGP